MDITQHLTNATEEMKRNTRGRRGRKLRDITPEEAAARIADKHRNEIIYKIYSEMNEGAWFAIDIDETKRVFKKEKRLNEDNRKTK